MNLSLLKYFSYIIIVLSTFIAHSSNREECEIAFLHTSKKHPSIDYIKSTITALYNKEVLFNTISTLEEFFHFIDQKTLELKDTETMKLYRDSTYATNVRMFFAEKEFRESAILKELNPETVIAEFIKKYSIKDSSDKDFITLYVRHHSFRQEVYKIQIFSILFANVLDKQKKRHLIPYLFTPYTNDRSLRKQSLAKQENNTDLRRNIQNFISSHNIDVKLPKIITDLKMKHSSYLEGEREKIQEFKRLILQHTDENNLTNIKQNLDIFLSLLNETTLELIDIDLSTKQLPEYIKDLVQGEIQVSKILEEINKNIMIHDFITEQVVKYPHPSSNLINFIEKYAYHSSFRKEIAKIAIFKALFATITPIPELEQFTFLNETISAILSPKWKKYFDNDQNMNFFKGLSSERIWYQQFITFILNYKQNLNQRNKEFQLEAGQNQTPV